MSQTVTSVATNLPNVTINDSNSSVYAATTSTVTTISPCPPQQQYSPPQSSVPSQYSQLSVYNAEGFQATQKIKLLTRPQTANGTPGSEAPLNHQAALMEQLASSTSNVVVGVSSATGLPVMAPTLSGEENNEWQPSVALVMPSERCDDENPSVNLQEFLFNTMRSPQDNRDRVFLLQLESMFTSYINDPLQTGTLTLPPDTSYHRMLAHRVAAYFGLKHSVDPTGNSVVVWKIAESKVPEQRFEDYIPVEEKDSLEPKKQILKRSKDLVVSVSQKLEQQPSGITNADMKSIEEKQEAYDRAKARIFSQEPSTSQPRNGSRQMLLSDPVENSNNSGNSTEHNDVSKLPPEGDSRDDTSPGSRSRSSSQGSNMSANRTTPSRNRSSNRRPQQTKYPSRQSYVPAGYVSNLATQPVSPGMLYYQQQQQAAMLQQYSTAAAAAAAGYPQYLQYAHNPMMPAAAAALYSQPNLNSYAFQPQPQQLYAMPGGQVYSVLANPAMRPPAMYMHSQQQGSFHHPHLQPTAAAATAGIIRPVPQHAQPQANRFVSKPVHGPGNSWKPTFTQQPVAAAVTQQLRANNNNVNTTTAAAAAAAAGNFQEYQLANYIESNLTLNDEARQETESPEQQQQQQPATSSSSQKLTQQATQTQYVVPQEQDVQNPTTAPESVAAIKFFPHMTSSGQVQYIATASPMVNSHGYQNQFTGVAVTAANPYSYQLQNAPSTPPINMINPSQPVLFSPPSSGPPTPSHYIPQGLFSPPPQPAILLGMGNQQISNLVTQQNSSEAITQTRQPEESGDNRNSGVVETGLQVTDASSTAKTVVSASSSVEAVQKRQTLNNQQQEVSTTATVTTNATTTTTTTVNKHKELNTGNAYTSAGLPPRFQQRSGGSTTRYQNQRHPSNRQNTKQVAMDANVAMTTNHYGPLSTNALPKREPLLPTPPAVTCIIPHEPIPSGGQEVLEILNFPAEGPQYQAALVELKKLNASILNIKKVNGAAIFVAKFESAHQAQLAMQQTIKQQQPYQLVVPTGQHSKIIQTALSRRQQSSNRTS